MLLIHFVAKDAVETHPVLPPSYFKNYIHTLV